VAGNRAVNPVSATRGVRASVFALSSTALAVAAHRVGGGAAPSTVAALIAFTALLALGWLLAGRQRGGPQLTALVLGTQAVLHLSFMATSMQMNTAVSGSSGASLASRLFCHTGSLAPTSAQIATALARIGTGPTQTVTTAHISWFALSEIPMLLAHLLAASVMAWWLRRGERAAWATLNRAVAAVIEPLSSRLVVIGDLVTPHSRPWAARSRIWASDLTGRGPPRPTQIISAIA
jgi:hypothetical protein